MKYSDLSDKDRYDVIKAGVKAGYTSLDDIEKYYNEFANGGHIFNGEEFSNMTDQDVYLQRLKQQQQQKLNLNPNFTNQMWNSKPMLDARLNSNDFLTQEAARREVERQKQFDESAKAQREKAGQFILKQAQAEYDAMHNDILNNPDHYDAVDIYKNVGKRPEKLDDVLKNYKFQDDAAETNKIGLTVASLPYIVPTKGSSSLFNTFARAYNGADLVSILKPEKEDVSLDPYITTNTDGTQTYNPYQQMVNANIADRSRKIQAEQAAKAATQTTTAPTSTLTQTTDTKVRVPVPASMQTPKQQITQQPVQQQVTQQKPTKIQGFMNKLGSAAPYIGDFVGWTLGNSKFFNYGGNIYETKDLH